MTQSLAVSMGAFCLLLVSAMAGLTTQGWPAWHSLLAAPRGLMRGMALGLLALAVAALGVLTFQAYGEFTRADAQARALAHDVAELDHALRRAGPEAEAARTSLFRYADVLTQAMRTAQRETALAKLGVFEEDLQRTVAELAFPEADSRTSAAVRLETALRATRAVLALRPLPGVKPCRPLLVAWMMAGLGLLALVTPPRRRSALALTVLAGVLSAGMFYLEELAAPFDGKITADRGVMDEMLFTIAE